MDTFQGMTTYMYDDWRLVPVGAWRAVQRVTRRSHTELPLPGLPRRALIGSRSRVVASGCIKKIFVFFYRS